MYGIQTEIICIDLAGNWQLNRLYEEIKKRQLSMETLITNVVFAEKGLFNKTDCKRQHEEMLITIVFLIELFYLFLSDMAQQKSGSFINIASGTSFNVLPYSAI